MNPILAVPAVVGGYLVLLGGIQLWSRLGKVDVETTRKSAHVGGALLTLPFPWIFPDLRLPLAISVGFMILLDVTRRKGWLRAIHGVERPSRGAFKSAAPRMLRVRTWIPRSAFTNFTNSTASGALRSAA